MVPDYDRAFPVRTEGYDFHQVVAVMDQGVTALLNVGGKSEESREYGGDGGGGDGPSSREAQVHLVIHDWGSVYGFIYSNIFSERVKSITSFDIGAGTDKNDPVITREGIRRVKDAHPELAPGFVVKV